jgi:hypothetical protein
MGRSVSDLDGWRPDRLASDRTGVSAQVASDEHRDRRGQPRSLTTLSPIRPERVAELRRRLRFVAYAPGVGRPLLELGTVQYAHWLIVSELPAPDGSGRPWRLNWRYLLFDATYDGSQEQYLRTFADVLPLRLTKLFGTCFGFQANVEEAPGSDRYVVPAAAFARFVDANQLEMEERHFSYARADSVATVRQALAIERVTRRCDRRRHRSLGRTQSEVQALALGPPATRPTLAEATFGPWLRRLRPAKAVNPLLLAAPLKHGAWARLEHTPLGRVPNTHFARIVRIPATMQQDLGHVRPDRLERDYLLFSADHDGTLDSYVTALWKNRTSLHDFFDSCVGFKEVEDEFEFRDWVRRHQLTVQYFVAGVPPRLVKEVRELVQDRELIALVTTEGAAGLADSGR